MIPPKVLFGSTGTILALKQIQARIKWIRFLHSFLHLGQKLIRMVEGSISFRVVETRKREARFCFGQFSFRTSPKRIHI